MPSFSEYAGKTAIVSGALNALGQGLVRDLAAAGCKVVALDKDEHGLRQLALPAPDLIEPVRLDCLETRNCAMLGEIWEDEPLHLLVALHALGPQEPQLGAVNSLLSLVSHLRAGLERGGGTVLLALRILESNPGPHVFASTAAFETATARLGLGLAARGARINGLLLTGPGPSQNAADVVRFLASDGASGINGVTIPVDLRGHD